MDQQFHDIKQNWNQEWFKSNCIPRNQGKNQIDLKRKQNTFMM